MPNTYFRFKQFTVHHELCAMKVGTDGVLLGAWAPLHGAHAVLDIGTGTGLIALMCAQRLSAAGEGVHIQAIDLDGQAVLQALANVAASPWPQTVEVLKQDILTYQPHQRFDAIVCNPPFFVDSLQCPDASRSSARHASAMPFQRLLPRVASLLDREGLFSVVLPTDVASRFIDEAILAGLELRRETRVVTVKGKEPKRTLLCFGFYQGVTPQRDELVMEHGGGVYTEAYRALLHDFYLKF